MNQILATLGELTRSFDHFYGDQVEKQQNHQSLFISIIPTFKICTSKTPTIHFANLEFEYYSVLLIFIPFIIYIFSDNLH